MRGRYVGGGLALIVLGVVVWLLLSGQDGSRGGAVVVATENRGEAPEAPSPPVSVDSLVPEDVSTPPVSTAPAVVAGAPAGEAAPATGCMEGWLLDTNGASVGMGTIAAKGLDEQGNYATDVEGDGSFAFEELPPGRYHLLVDPDSLPDGYRPPVKQEQLSPGTFGWNPETRRREHRPVTRRGLAPAYYGSVALVEANATAEVFAYCYRPSEVHGYVYLRQSGEPVPQVFVRLLSRMRVGHFSQDTFTDETGAYVIRDVVPGWYRLQVSLGKDHPLKGSADRSPWTELPRIFDGDSYRQDVWMGGGTSAIRGVLVDQEGVPYPDIKVIVYYVAERETSPEGYLLEGASSADRNGTGRTDETGHFHLDRLYEGRVGVQFHPNAWGLGEVPFAGHGPVFYLDLAPGRTEDLDRIVAPRSKPFLFDITVVLDEAWVAERGVRKHDVTLEIRRPAGSPEPEAGALDSIPDRGLKLRDLEDAEPLLGFPAEGTLFKVHRWGCETPFDASHVELELSFKKRRDYEQVPSVKAIVVPREGRETLVLTPPR